ncbi:AAA family ATPase [uncultured Acidaminococcus sp.]|uniref:AAA family ATPase n=1 Tax=uncultured Acidaminococcus sp. TaxID=352152 RepID=UPI002596070F|nr:AAA family ATPase [uncultured Acidaminococcus sp.]
MKINTLEIENVKRVKAVKLEPSANGLTIIGGKNGQGKTSVLDAIMWGLGGDKFRPSVSQRTGALVPPSIHIELDNGLVVERKGVNSALKVVDATGKKSGQKLLDAFISKLALNLPAFLSASDKEKADTLLKIIGVGDQLKILEEQEKKLYFQRTEIGRYRDMKEKAAKNMPSYPNVPTEQISVSELIKQQQAILAQNGENQKKRENAAHYDQVLKQARAAYEQAKTALEKAEQDCMIARKAAEDLQDESTAELEKNIAGIEEINQKIRINEDKKKAEEEADSYSLKYNQLTDDLDEIRNQRQALLDGADLPLPGLSVEEGKLIYNNVPWDGMSGAEQLKVATAIVRKLNPECGFVLMDKLEQMDLDTLQEFGDWLKNQGLQVIATRVSTGSECSIIIEDGMVKGTTDGIVPSKPKFTAGAF